MAFDFGIISEVLTAVFDGDLMTVKRNIEVPRPNRPPITEEVEIYTDLPCFFDFKQSDNPNPQTVDTRPINITGILFCDESIELQNADFITVRKMTTQGTVLEIYQGEIGKPSVYPSHQECMLNIRQNV